MLPILIKLTSKYIRYILKAGGGTINSTRGSAAVQSMPAHSTQFCRPQHTQVYQVRVAVRSTGDFLPGLPAHREVPVLSCVTASVMFVPVAALAKTAST